MEITNLELIDKHRALKLIGELKIKKEDPPEVKRAIMSIVSRVGLNLKRLRDQVEQYGEQQNELVMRHAARDSAGNPIPVHDDHGNRIGAELKDLYAFNHEQRMLSKTKVSIPDDLATVKLSELLAVGFELDGNVAGMLGDSLIHDIQPTVEVIDA